MSMSEVTINETKAHEFKAGGVLAFTLAAQHLVGKVKSGGGLKSYAVPCIDVVLKYLETAPPHEVEKARKVIEERK